MIRGNLPLEDFPTLPARLGLQAQPLRRTQSTMPVPPPVDGGPLGTLLASLVLSLEVLVSLLGGAAAWVLRGFGMLTSKRGTLSPAGALAVPVDAASAPGRGAFSGLLKYLVALFVIGAVVMGLLLFLVIGAQEQ